MEDILWNPLKYINEYFKEFNYLKNPVILIFKKKIVSCLLEYDLHQIVLLKHFRENTWLEDQTRLRGNISIEHFEQIRR